MTLEADHLSLTLGRRLVLADVSHSFAAGQVTVILGPNGAGKSSLLRCLSGLLPGRVRLDSAPLAAFTPRQRARTIGYLAQQAAIHWDMAAQSVVALGRLPWRNADDAPAIASAMAATDTEKLAGRPLSALSGGERARVLFARVLAGTPRWILADEPLAALDPAYQMQMCALLRRAAAGGAGVVVVLHDLNLAARLADQLFLLKDGRLLAAGPPATVLTAARLHDLYGIDFTIHTTGTGGGGPVILPATAKDSLQT